MNEKDMKEIDALVLLEEILSYRKREEYIDFKRFPENEYWESTSDGIYTMRNPEVYIKYVKEKIEDYKLKKHIFLDKNDHKKLKKITISRLKVLMNHGDFGFFTYFSAPLDVEFKDNIFQKDVYPIYIRQIDFSDIYPLPVLSFINNTFEKTDIHFNITNCPRLKLKGNTFNGLVMLDNDFFYDNDPKDTLSEVVQRSMFLSSGKVEKIYATRHLEQKLNNRWDIEKTPDELKQKIKNEKESISNKDILKALLYANDKVVISPEQVEQKDSHFTADIADNDFTSLHVSGNMHLNFTGTNKIKGFQVFTKNHFKEELKNVYWGPHQKIGLREEHVHYHKKIFCILKQRATDRNDAVQEVILRREISRFDHAIAKAEKIFKWAKNDNSGIKTRIKDSINWGALQNRLIFALSKHLSDHGASWFRPLLLLLATNAAIAGYIYYFYPAANFVGSDNLNWSAVFFGLSSPNNYLSAYLPELFKIESQTVVISSISILQKIIYTFSVYEIIKAFRRFGRF